MSTIYSRESSRPLSDADKINRMALATGAPRVAAHGIGADYNGHRYVMGRIGTGHRLERRWGISYIWAGVRWVGTSSDFTEALDMGIRALEAGAARGGSFSVSFSDEVPTDEMLSAMSERGLSLL